MIAPILSALFPPDPRKLRVPPGALLLHAIRMGEIKANGPEIAQGWAGNVREWRDGRWRELVRE